MEDRLAVIEGQMGDFAGTLRTILEGIAGLRQVLPRLERVEQAQLRKEQISPSGSSASTHVMVDYDIVPQRG